MWYFLWVSIKAEYLTHYYTQLTSSYTLHRNWKRSHIQIDIHHWMCVCVQCWLRRRFNVSVGCNFHVMTVLRISFIAKYISSYKSRLNRWIIYNAFNSCKLYVYFNMIIYFLLKAIVARFLQETKWNQNRCACMVTKQQQQQQIINMQTLIFGSSIHFWCWVFNKIILTTFTYPYMSWYQFVLIFAIFISLSFLVNFREHFLLIFFQYPLIYFVWTQLSSIEQAVDSITSCLNAIQK